MENNTTVFTESRDVLAPPELASMSNEQLRSELARSLTMSAKHLAYLAVVWSELERRGENLDDLRTGLASYLPQIAAGRLDADAVIRFAGQPTVLRYVSALPLDRQRELAYGAPLRVLTVSADGTFDSAEMPAYTLTASQARLVFNGDRTRTPDEQRAMLLSQQITAKRRATPGPEGRVRYDKSADVLRIGKASATVGEVIGALAMRERDPSADIDPATVPFVIKFSELDSRALKIRVAESGLSQQEFFHRLIVKHALV